MAVEELCDDCGLPVSICNAKAMVQIAIAKHGADAVARVMPAKLNMARIAQLEAVVAAGDGLAEAVLEVRASKQAWADRDKTEMFGPSGGFSILNRVDAAQESLTAALTTYRAAKDALNAKAD